MKLPYKTAMIHEYSLSPSDKRLKHSAHKRDGQINEFIKGRIISEPDNQKVFLILNGIENDEEAIVVENRQLMHLFSRNAILAVQTIACLPFEKQGLIEAINRKLYTDFRFNDYILIQKSKEEEEEEEELF